MNKIVYPIVLTPDEKDEGYCVYIPDFDKNTEGDNLADALDMAQDAIEMMGVYLQDIGEAIPAPGDISRMKISGGQIKTLVSADFDEYRRKTEKRIVKKTVGIPSWLNVKAEEEGINFSATLQTALKERLGIAI